MKVIKLSIVKIYSNTPITISEFEDVLFLIKSSKYPKT